jgi:hypothetical protein
MVFNDHTKSAGFYSLLLFGLALLTCIPGAAARVGPPINRRFSVPVANLTALSDGSLGNIPAQMLLYQAVLVKMNRTATAPPPSSDVDKQEGSGDQKEAEDKKKRDKKNGAVLGSVLGGALATGLADADNPARALCKALVVGASSAVGVKTAQLIGSAQENDEEENTNTDVSSSSTVVAQPLHSSQPNDFGAGMVGPSVGKFVGTGVSAGLGKGICDGLFGDAGKWFLKIANQFLPHDIYDVGKIAMEEALANGRIQILARAMENAGVPVHQASQFVNELDRNLQRFQDFGLDGVAEELQRDLLNGASQIADVIAAGQGAAIAPALEAMDQLGVVIGLASSTVPFMGTPVQQFQGLTDQLSQFNAIASSFSPGTQIFKQAQPIIKELHDAASRAVEDGSGALKNVGKGVKSSLGLFAPHHEKEKVHHVTKTHVFTQTHHVTKTHHETDHMTKTDHASKTDHVTKTDHATKTQLVKETQTFTKTEEEKHKVTTTVTVTKTKEVKTTATKTKTKGVKVTVIPAAPGVKDPSLFNLSSNVVCHLNKERHLQCFGTDKNAVKYDEVSDKTFKKCVGKNEAKCFDKHMNGPVRYFADRDDKIRGVACAMKGTGVMCWGTPKHGAVKYKTLKQQKFNECMYNVKECN